MKKFNFLLLMIILLSSTKLFGVSEIVNLATAGTLSTSLVNDKTTVTDLKITGNLDYSDFLFMKTEMTVLANIDLSEATINEYTDSGTSIIYPANTIPNGAFTSKLTISSIKFPTSAVMVDNEAFNGCTNLTSVDYGTSLQTIGNNTFKNCANLVSIPNNLPLISIGTYSFYTTGITGQLILPEGLPAIGEAAFHSCQNLTSVTIPSTVTTIGLGAFAGKSGTTSNILTFNIYASAPPTLGANVFLRKNVNSVLHVPVGCKDAYLNTGLTSWTAFSQIIEDLIVSGVNENKFNTSVQTYITDNTLVIKSDNKLNSLCVFSANGNAVYVNNKLNSNDINLTLFSKGIYLLRFSFSDGIPKTIKIRY